ncbi:hypothetical protein BOSE62_130666 [Bosea sp. 62]|uniref:hypothetical protein n=1 Tax=unclassified Bosea (in: a-proteobacteria) TaxID=2653178 RepID=UPI001256516D|nr:MULTISPECIES: hypothetical protein [unclassified Bosea (in: a-proteobacteria)]CAD5255725.1 hypothetical protein BOSE7B_120686 [Bosea sp. 7B]CAD5275046.1 hypothetical protein BOSE21B_30226 [Bosea sp. 21B]CAD5276178.1 hypothetical protein BOSE46_30087 [Bosea sp. 46]VVT60035.1 hypothetical protein BOS5A_210826 [Bosea sp. EC-HK365B]VXB52542.1 hypothetical protein BOSE62_130666 [Bosea sp. 62]
MGWTLKLDRQREWPAKTFVDEIGFKDPTLFLLRQLPEIERIRNLPDRSSLYETNWQAVYDWLKALVEVEANSGLVDMLTPAEAERAKAALLGFFTSPAAETAPAPPPTTSSSAPESAKTRIE